MASTGAFTISNGGTPSSSTDRGFTAAAGDELEFALEASPAFDVVASLYEVVLPTAGAPAVVLSTSSPSPPTAAVTTDPLDVGVYSFVVRCTVTLVTGRLAIFERIVAIPNGLGQRKIIAGETLEFSAPRGWTDAFNALVDVATSFAILTFDVTLDHGSGMGSTATGKDLSSATIVGIYSSTHYADPAVTVVPSINGNSIEIRGYDVADAAWGNDAVFTVAVQGAV